MGANSLAAAVEKSQLQAVQHQAQLHEQVSSGTLFMLGGAARCSGQFLVEYSVCERSASGKTCTALPVAAAKWGYLAACACSLAIRTIRSLVCSVSSLPTRWPRRATASDCGGRSGCLGACALDNGSRVACHCVRQVSCLGRRARRRHGEPLGRVPDFFAQDCIIHTVASG